MGFLSILRRSLSTKFRSSKYYYSSKKAAAKRIIKELKNGHENPPTHISYGLLSVEDPFHMQGVIVGPSDTPYEGAIFFLSIEFPYNYPFKPPKVIFQSEVYHQNIGKNGKIRIDILEEMWSPALTIEKLLLSICSVLPEPYLLNRSF